MTIEQQVVSFNLAKRLKELRVKQESLFTYSMIMPAGERIILNTEIEPHLPIERHAAFTVAELGELLGTELTDVNESDSFTLKCGNAIDFWWAMFGNDEANI